MPFFCICEENRIMSRRVASAIQQVIRWHKLYDTHDSFLFIYSWRGVEWSKDYWYRSPNCHAKNVVDSSSSSFSSVKKCNFIVIEQQRLDTRWSGTKLQHRILASFIRGENTLGRRQRGRVGEKEMTTEKCNSFISSCNQFSCISTFSVAIPVDQTTHWATANNNFHRVGAQYSWIHVNRLARVFVHSCLYG